MYRKNLDKYILSIKSIFGGMCGVVRITYDFLQYTFLNDLYEKINISINAYI